MGQPFQWGDLQFFLAVCERGSIGAAAQSLRVNHSTVLRRIAGLEQSLGVRLFDRLPAGYSLTAQGHELAASIAGVSETLESAQRRLGGGDLQLSGTIRLTAPDTLVQGLLLPHLAEFRRLHPQLQLELVVNNSFLNLTQREADVAVRGSNRPPENLIGRHAGDIQTAMYAASTYLQSLGPSASTPDYHWVGHDASLAHLSSAQWMQENVDPERVAIRLDSLVAMTEAVAAGFGVGWLLCPLGDARPALQRLAAPPPEFDTQIWVLTHPDLKRVARIKALTDFLYERLSADPRLLHPAKPTARPKLSRGKA